MRPSGAVRAGPPAAQANRTANFNAHEYKKKKPGGGGFERARRRGYYSVGALSGLGKLHSSLPR